MPRTGYIEPTGPLTKPSIVRSGEDPSANPEIARLPDNMKQGASQRMQQLSSEVSTDVSYQAVREADYSAESEAMAAAEQVANEQAAMQAAAAVSVSDVPIQRVTGGADDPSLQQAQGPVPEQETGYIVDAVG